MLACSSVLNVLAARAVDQERVADELVHLLQALYRDSWGPRTSMVLRNAFQTLTRVAALFG